MPYFDPDEAYDRSLLACPDDVAIVKPNGLAARVEREVLRRFTVRSSGSSVVLLSGHDEATYSVDRDVTTADGFDADRAQWTGLCQDLRETIADVIGHRLTYKDHTPKLKAESLGKISKTYDKPLDPLWPHGWDWRLKDYKLASSTLPTGGLASTMSRFDTT